jgi:microsomal prostaglandin-E synthase 2
MVHLQGMDRAASSPARATLYQFTLCPFCNKVRAALDLTGVAYDKVEVSPRNKKELPPLPEDAPKKVPVLLIDNKTIYDSTTILEYICERPTSGLALKLDDEAAQQQSREYEEWIDENFIQALPTVIYGTQGEAAQAAKVIARESKYSPLKALSVRLVGSFIMRRVAKRILAKAGRSDGHAWVEANLDQFEEWLGDKTFLVGEQPSMADAAMHGALNCVREFPIFEKCMRRARVAQWFKHVEALRTAHRG